MSRGLVAKETKKLHHVCTAGRDLINGAAKRSGFNSGIQNTCPVDLIAFHRNSQRFAVRHTYKFTVVVRSSSYVEGISTPKNWFSPLVSTTSGKLR